MTDRPAWRRAAPSDLDAVMAVQAVAHGLLPERREVIADKLDRFGEGCLVLGDGGRVVGYGLAHPWRLDDAPALDTLLARAQAPDCLFLHDVALLPEARGRGAARAFVRHAAETARAHGLASLALVSVYGTVPVWARLGFAVRDVPALAPKLAGYGADARYMTAAAV